MYLMKLIAQRRLCLHCVQACSIKKSECHRLLKFKFRMLIIRYRVIRTQAYKTLDVFLNRVKTLTANMPDSAIPPANGEQAGLGAPRMGTPQNDASWAGWAISSFTKKLGSVTGEIEPQAQ